MIARIRVILPDERSEAVANLHKAMRALGFAVASAEVAEQRAGEQTSALVRLFQQQSRLIAREDVLVDEATALAMNMFLASRGLLSEPAPRPHTVAGVVMTAAGKPAVGLNVTAFDRDMRKRQLLGKAVTDARGQYSIGYDAGQFSGAEVASADLVIEVSDTSGKILYTSDVRFNAAYMSVIDVTLPAATATAEYDHIDAVLTTLINGQDVTLATLEEDGHTNDLTFAAADSGLEYEALMDFAIAQRLAATPGTGKTAAGLPAPFWYAVLRSGAITENVSASRTAPGLGVIAADIRNKATTTPPAAIEAALKRALASNLIAAKFTDTVPSWLTLYAAMQTEAGKAPDAPASQIGAVAGLGAKAQSAFAEAFHAGGSREDILARLETGKVLTAKQVADLETTLTLHDLVLGDTNLLRAVKPGFANVAAVPQIAKLQTSDWIATLKTAGVTTPDFVAGASDDEKRANYAQLLTRRMALTYPTAAFAGRMAKARQSPLPQADKISAFIDAHPDFELATTSVDGYLKSNNVTRAFRDAAEDADFVQGLKATQRVFKLTKDYDASATLLKDKVHSAAQIYRLGKGQFVGTYKGRPGFETDGAAEKIWNAAANTYAAVLTILGDLRATQNANQIQGLSNPAPALKDLPDWSDLFGPADSCACDDCASIFSPSAYLADLLKWLESRRLVGTSKTAKDVLFERRPDIGDIELTCENSQTALPYIDLACEIMEDQVASWKLFDAPAGTAFASGAPDASVKGAFGAAVPPITLSGMAMVYGPDAAGAWIVRDKDVTYLAKPTATGFAVSIARQTRAPSDELMAYPEYTNSAAYDALSGAVRPLALPFDLYPESARAYLDLAGQTRADIMRVFRGNDPSNPSDLDIACEYLGIGVKEQTLIFSADPDNQHLYWGGTKVQDAIDQMGQVKTFLERTGLVFADLQRLLSLDFVNPGGTIAIQNADASCDLSQKTLQGLDKAALDRIHRFLRLWRKLGWKMWEVDLVIRTPGLGTYKVGTNDVTALDPKLALALFPFLRLKARLGSLSIEQMCAFYDAINTRSKFTEAYKTPEPSLYESLFLNKRTSGALDPDFAIAAVTAPSKIIDDAHRPRVLAAARLKAADLDIVMALTKPGPPPGTPFIDNQLSLDNLSFVVRHGTLLRGLGMKAGDWQTLLRLTQVDPFADPQTTFDFVTAFDQVKACGLSVDQLDWLLTANPAARAAVPDKTAAAFLGGLRTALKAIANTYDPSTLPTDADGLGDAISARLQVLGWDSASAADAVAILKGTISLGSQGPLGAGIAFPGVANARYDGATGKIYYIGVMSDADKTAMLTAATPAPILADPNFIAAVNELYDLPRLTVRRYFPIFDAPLSLLPADVQLSQLGKALAARVSYDADRQMLSIFGVMSNADRKAILALSGDTAYQTAVQALYQQARAAPAAADQWLAANELSDNLATAALRLTTYLEHKLSVDQTVQQVAAAFGFTQATAANLLNGFALFGGSGRTLTAEFMDSAFVASDAGVSRDTFPSLMTDYVWLSRVALILKTAAATDADLLWMEDNPTAKGVLDLSALPLSSAGTTATSPTQLAALVGWLEVMALHHAWSNGQAALTDVIDRLVHDAAYTADMFAADAEILTGWHAADVKALTPALNLAYPTAYATPAGWRRLNDAFAIIAALSGSASSVLKLAGTTVDQGAEETLRGMLHAQYSEADWLTNNRTVQDGLRQRKRDSLIAYLLMKGAPPGAPNAPWTTADDLFDYYLIDVQMCSCQPTTRVVQAYAAVQLFVQRCLMGLESEARASSADDEGWKQWDWMKFYRLWEANRRVFAYPENYAEPDLRKDKSDLFRNLENALLQNGVTRDNVESAFLDYLTGLDDIAQLEIAGTFYQESIQTLHVFGRTAGGDPRLYYYRQFIAGRRWTPWSKIDIDVKGNYLTPFVMHDRLYAVWLEFQENPASTQSSPVPSSGDTVTVPGNGGTPMKTMKVFLAISELRNGKWTAKKVADTPFETQSFSGTYDDTAFLIVPLDLTWLPGILFPNGLPAGAGPVPSEWQWLIDGRFLIEIVDNNTGYRQTFAMAGCRGYPEAFDGDLDVRPVVTTFQDSELIYGRDVGQWATDLTPEPGTLIPPDEILAALPSKFKVLYPHYLSLIDRIVFLIDVLLALSKGSHLGHASPANGETALAFSDERGIVVKTTLGTFYDWFYADSKRTFHVRPELYLKREKLPLYYENLVDLAQEISTLITPAQWPLFLKLMLRILRGDVAYQLHFGTFYHPLTCRFISELYSDGIDGLLSRDTQFADGGLDFAATYQPQSIVNDDYPNETAVFDDPMSDYAHGYASYNWELFYFAPLMVAERLSQNQQFEDAMSWYHHIFDPTGGHDRDPISNALASAPQKYWITKPFYLRQSQDYLQQRIENLMTLLADDPASPTDPALLLQLQNQVKDWRNDPFDPHLVAQYRTVAYQKVAVMKYLDNLIAWGDQQFTIDSLESVNIATQLYVLAAHILGQRPAVVPPPEKPAPETFNEINAKLDAFSNAFVQFENLLPPMPGGGGGNSGTVADLPGMLYFGIPQNDQLLGYWDTVEDRLYKIRHCLNIDGVFSPPAIFPPPVDPMALVRAAASGADLSTAMADLNAPVPYYRFHTLLQMANAVCADVKALGQALLSALEKKDAEGLANLRQSHEIAVLQAVRNVKLKQIDEANIALEGLQKTRELTTIRRDYYSSREFMNAGEIAAAALSSASLAIDAAIAVGYALSGGLKLVPEFMIGAAGFGGSPTANAQTGGNSFGNSAEDAVKTISSIATALDKASAVASVVAGYQRRMDDWQLQVRTADKELEQIDRQIAGARKRIETAQTELANQDLQIANAQSVNDFMHNKYTNEELYQWLSGQISQTYFQSYNLACDTAKKAEKCLQHELGLENTSYIQSGYWNSLKSGLQAAESLQLDLRRMESDYHALNKREFECVKQISLALVDPIALLRLKSEGICIFQIPEELFDLDYPGHYFRRIKSVSLSVPCIAGPYTTVNATLRLLNNSIRVTSAAGSQYEHNNDSGAPTDDDRFRQNHVRLTAIAASSGQNDSGMFELNFHDERYLPFEGAGAISTWQVELMTEPSLRTFDYSTISDVILHLHYTAREDAGPFRDSAITHLKAVVSGNAPELPQWRLFDLMHEFPSEWYALWHPAGGASPELRLALTRRHFGFLAQGKDVNVTSITVVSQNTVALKVTVEPFTDTVTTPLSLAVPSGTAACSKSTLDGQDQVLDETTPWVLTFSSTSSLTSDNIAACYLVVGYTLT